MIMEEQVRGCSTQDEISTKKYATGLFEKSLVTGVSNIVGTKNRFNKCFKILVLVLCTSGFFYQATEFVVFYFTHPYLIDVDVYSPEEVMRPAYTFCNNNGIKRSKYCEKYPDNCYEPENIDDFCKEFKEFCSYFEDIHNTTIKIPNPQLTRFVERDITAEELRELGHTIKTLLIGSTINAENLSGPFVARGPEVSSTDSLLLCYTAYSRIDSELDPVMLTDANKEVKDYVDVLHFDVERQEIFWPGRKPGIVFIIHSPFELENPATQGAFIKPGRKHIFEIEIEEEHLLPGPYRTICTNYTELWEKTGKNGPRSRKMNVRKLILDRIYDLCNCSDALLPYIVQKEICQFAKGEPSLYCLVPDGKSFMDNIDGRIRSLQNECVKRTYKYEFETRYIENQYGVHDIEDQTRVVISLKSVEVKQFRYRAQYKGVEVFSYIGGFLGVWIGVSLVVLIFLESVFLNTVPKLRRKLGRITKSDNSRNQHEEI